MITEVFFVRSTERKNSNTNMILTPTVTGLASLEKSSTDVFKSNAVLTSRFLNTRELKRFCHYSNLKIQK